MGPSLASIYAANLAVKNAACIAISQSGQSPDSLKMLQALRQSGAMTLAMSNVPTSPLAKAAHQTIPLRTGPETSVAATKTHVASLVAMITLLAHWREDKALIAAIDQLPTHLEQATAIHWPNLQTAFADITKLFVVGRGISLACANEAALKFKETCQIFAEGYSTAEILHGPVALIEPRFPILAFAARDASSAAMHAVCEQLSNQGADLYATLETWPAENRLDCVPSAHPLLDPIVQIVSFYVFIERLAHTRGINPDTPRHLKKVTETL